MLGYLSEAMDYVASFESLILNAIKLTFMPSWTKYKNGRH